MSKPVKRGASSRKQAASKAEELTARMIQWTEREMGLNRSQLPPNEDIKILLSNSAGSSMWQYLMTHISTPKTVQLIRKNIQLQSGDVSGARARLLTERAELSRELTSLRLAITQLETDLSRLNSDISTAAGVKGVTSGEVRECSRKSHFLSAHSVKCQDMVNVINEFSKRIRYRIQVLSHQSKEKSYFAKSGDSKAHSLQLESACKHDLGRACDQVGALLTQLAAATREGGGAKEEDKNRQAKEQIWNKLELLLSGYSPAELMQCLCELTHEAREIVHTDTTNVDLNRDAKLLKYHYDNGEGLQDEVKRLNLLKSVEEHLMVLQLSHLQRSVELERCLGSVAKAHERLSQLKSGVDDHLSSVYGEDKEGAELARAVFHVDLEVCGCQGALAAITHICERLNSIREDKRQVVKTLEDKQNSINQFTQIAEEKQSSIQSLVQANSGAWSRLNKQQNELEVYIRTKVVHHESELVPLAAGLHDSVNFELQRFSQLSLARMLRAPGILGQPFPDLTIHRLSNAHPNGLPHWAELLETVGVASYEAPEAILSRLNDIIDKVEDLRSLVHEKEGTAEDVKSSSINTLTAKGVLLASRRCDRQQLEAGVPALQSSLSVASQGLAKCSTVQQTLHEWWEQPAQFSGHWITYEGMTLERWVEQWRVLSAKLQRVTSSNSISGSGSMATTANKAAS